MIVSISMATTRSTRVRSITSRITQKTIPQPIRNAENWIGKSAKGPRKVRLEGARYVRGRLLGVGDGQIEDVDNDPLA